MINENENMSEKSVTAIAKSGNKLKAVELCKRGGTIEVTMTKNGDENAINWQDFAVKCGLPIGPITEEQTENRKPVVVGYDSAGTAFSRVNIPVVEDKEVESMVQLQAESRLPLPADQMELAWRADQEKEGQLAITIAAARRQQVQSFIDKVISFRPANVFLDCEGIVKIWKNVFSGNEQNAVIINTDARNTQICLSSKGHLINAVAMDMGTDDFAQAETDQQTENLERFVQDTRSIVDLFGIEKLRVFVLSDGSATYTDLASALMDAGLNATAVKPDINKFNAKGKLNVKDIFEYRLQIGLALMVIEATGNELNLFRNLYRPQGEEKQKHWLYSPKIAGAIAASILVMFLGVCYAIDVAKPAKIDEIIKKHTSGQDFKDITELVDKYNVLKYIEKERPDLLKLISILTVNEAGQSGRMGSMNQRGIQLDSLDFKKGKKITITGQASGTGQVSANDTLYNFEEMLNKLPELKNIELSLTTQNRSGSSSAVKATTTASTRTNPNSRVTSGTAGMLGGRVATSSMGSPNNQGIRFQVEFSYLNFSGNTAKTVKKVK